MTYVLRSFKRREVPAGKKAGTAAFVWLAFLHLIIAEKKKEGEKSAAQASRPCGATDSCGRITSKSEKWAELRGRAWGMSGKHADGG